jgi:hypothetical protein
MCFDSTLKKVNEAFTFFGSQSKKVTCSTLADVAQLVAATRSDRVQWWFESTRRHPKTMNPQHQEQIERALERPLRGDELMHVGTLAEITPAARRVAKVLVRRQLVLCALYLRAIATLGSGEVNRFIDDLSSDTTI